MDVNPFKGQWKRCAPLLLALGLTALTGCGGGGSGTGNAIQVNGPSQTVAGGTVYTWALLDSDRQVQEVAVTVPFTTIQNATGDPTIPLTILDFPAEVKNTTFFDHFELNWLPSGQTPNGAFANPLLDFHFYSQPHTQLQTIDCTDNTAITSDRLPGGYSLPTGTLQENCTAQQGVRVSPPAGTAGSTFTGAIDYGYYAGQLISIEPLLTKDYLIQQPSFALDVTPPAKLGKTTLFPTRLTVVYDISAKAYQFVFGNFVGVQ